MTGDGIFNRIKENFFQRVVEVMELPLRWIMWAGFVWLLVFSSGCSLVYQEMLQAAKKSEKSDVEASAEKKEPTKADSEGEQSSDSEDVADAQEPVNGSAGNSDGFVDSKQVKAGQWTLWVDQQNWQQTKREKLDTDQVYTQFNVDGNPEGSEVVALHEFADPEHRVSVSRLAQAMKKRMEEKSIGSVDWQVLEQHDQDMMVFFSQEDSDAGRLEGFVRFIQHGEGIIAVFYITQSVPMPDQEKAKWKYLLQQAGQEKSQVTL
jgi:hypothetical protein